MPRNRHTAEEIVAKLRQAEALAAQGLSIAQAVREVGVPKATYYRWAAGHADSVGEPAPAPESGCHSGRRAASGRMCGKSNGDDDAAREAPSFAHGGRRTFAAALDAEIRARREVISGLRLALERGEFELYYQTIVDAASGAAVGAEALARWRHPQRGLVPPDQFIPVIEASDLINPFGAWVLQAACQEAASWPRSMKLSVNVSAAQFRSGDLATILRDALSRSGIAPERLELEITESVLLRDDGANVSQLRQMKDLGVSIAIDDFGVGYSSLGELRMFRFDMLKIDKTFVRDLPTRDDCLAIVGAVTSLARSLNIATTAEGVETAEQLALVRAAGCSYAQGYYFSRPGPAESLDFLRPLRAAIAAK